VYSVWIKSIQKWAYRHIESMDRDELTQVRSHVEKSKIRNAKQSKALDHRLLYIDTLMRTKQLDFGESEEGAEQVKKPA
ncbi:MAG: hypothetical protein LBS75_02515, partial [Synergistaceae bacterium]|nr:hypothetical protein [Synergistaceae bacterium]